MRRKKPSETESERVSLEFWTQTSMGYYSRICQGGSTTKGWKKLFDYNITLLQRLNRIDFLWELPSP